MQGTLPAPSPLHRPNLPRALPISASALTTSAAACHHRPNPRHCHFHTPNHLPPSAARHLNCRTSPSTWPAPLHPLWTPQPHTTPRPPLNPSGHHAPASAQLWQPRPLPTLTSPTAPTWLYPTCKCSMPPRHANVYFFLKKRMSHQTLVINIYHWSKPLIFSDYLLPFCHRNSVIIYH